MADKSFHKFFSFSLDAEGLRGLERILKEANAEIEEGIRRKNNDDMRIQLERISIIIGDTKNHTAAEKDLREFYEKQISSEIDRCKILYNIDLSNRIRNMERQSVSEILEFSNSKKEKIDKLGGRTGGSNYLRIYIDLSRRTWFYSDNFSYSIS